jgi:hypothetical protein
VTAPRFTSADIDRAYWDWQCSCGPAALAAILGLTLDEVKPLFMPAFPGWTTPTRMLEALRRANKHWSSIAVPARTRTTWPVWGVARIQWEGPWTAPGANQRWAYTHTHWVGVSRGKGSRDQHLIDIFDVNTVGGGGPLEDGWGPLEWWSRDIVPLLTKDIKRATGGWYITHAIEVAR